MAKYEDGSYGSAAGIALIAKVLAGRCAMKYTRVAVGKGNIPDDKTPKTMTEPADYVMDAVIAGITNPVDGECQVTVQINSANVDKSATSRRPTTTATTRKQPMSTARRSCSAPSPS